MPFLGAAIGAGAGASLSTSLENEGIDAEFIKRVGEEVTEATSALFALTSGAADREEVVAELTQQYDLELGPIGSTSECNTDTDARSSGECLKLPELKEPIRARYPTIHQ